MCTLMDLVLLTYLQAGVVPIVVPPEALPSLIAEIEADTGADLDGATRAFTVPTLGGALIGVEVDGCLRPPFIGRIGPAPSAVVPDGVPA